MQLFNGKYKLEERLGQGASAEVWKATDTLTDTTLALKIYSPTNGMGTNGYQMLAHEFKIMVSANHQNLLKPLHFDIDENRPFLVLTYCEKGNIDKFRGTLSVKQAWKLLKDVAGGLAYLHDMKPPLIHQDIKPANILIDDNDNFVLTDFGVSAHAKAQLHQNGKRGELKSAGTIAYMPPEKFRSDSSPIMKNDIWSLGATVYEMITNDLPFGNDGGLSQTPSTQMPDMPASIPPTLSGTILKCLSYHPWDRPDAKEIYEIATKELERMEVEETKVYSTKPSDSAHTPTPTPIPIPDPIHGSTSETMQDPISDQITDSPHAYFPDPAKPTISIAVMAVTAAAGLVIGILLAIII